MQGVREGALSEALEPLPEEEALPEGMRRDPDGKLRPVGVPFVPGNRISSSRPKGLAKRIRDMVGDDPSRIADVLFDILEDNLAKNSDRIAAAKELLDRGWGKAPTFSPIEGGDPLETSELDKAIRDIADQLRARAAHPTIDAKFLRVEVEEGVRPPE